MKSLFRKSVIAILMLVIIVQMTGSVFAGSYEWLNGGKIYIAVVIGANDKQEIHALTNNQVQHTQGQSEEIIIPALTYITCNANTNFPQIYKTQLNNALVAEGLCNTVIYDKPVGDLVKIDANSSTGTYIARVIFHGKDGDWSIKVMENSESTPMTITSGTFLYAPSFYEVKAYKID